MKQYLPTPHTFSAMCLIDYFLHRILYFYFLGTLAYILQPQAIRTVVKPDYNTVNRENES